MKNIIPNISAESCKEAMEYYQKVFGGEIENVQITDGKEMFQGQEGKILHAELHINADCILYLNDTFEPKTKGNNINLLLQMDSEDEINRVYSALTENGNVVFPLQKTFWGSYHAVVTDRYDIAWSLDYSER